MRIRTLSALIAGAAALTIAGCSSSTVPGTSAPGVTTAARTHTVAPATSAPKAPTIGEQVYEWYTGVSDHFTAISTDQGAISDAAGNSDPTGVQIACADLKRDVITFESDPAAPDPKIRSYLAHAMDAYSTAASECLDGDLETAANGMGTGTRWISRATERVKEMGSGD